jgi:hypothetical protein
VDGPCSKYKELQVNGGSTEWNYLKERVLGEPIVKILADGAEGR